MDSTNCTRLLLNSDSSPQQAEASRSTGLSTQLHPQRGTTLTPQRLTSAMQQPQQRLTQIILESCSPQNALLKITNALGETFQPDACMIAPQTSPYSTLQATCWFPNCSACFSSQMVGLLSHPAIQSALATADLLNIPDVTEQPGAASVFSNMIAHPIRAILLVRTRFQGQSNGVVILTRSHSHLWTELEMQQLSAVSEAVAIAISQAQLQEKLQQQTQYQCLLDQLVEAIRVSRDLDQIFQLAVKGTASALKVSRGFVLMLKYAEPGLKNYNLERLPSARVTLAQEWFSPDQASQREQSPTSRNQAQVAVEAQPTQSFQVSECRLCQQVFTNKPAPVVISGYGETVSGQGSLIVHPEMDVADVFHLEQLPALLLVPLTHQGTVLGFLALQHDQPCAWQPEEVAFVKLIATQLSTAVMQVHTLQQVQALVEERTAQLRRSLDVQAKLYEKTRQQIEQLRHLNQLKDEFLSTMSHELLTPLTSMTLAIRMLRQANLSPERQAKYLEILEQQCAQETSLINDLLELQKLNTRSIASQLQKIDIKYLIRDLTQSFQESWAKKSLTLVLDLSDLPLTLYSHPENLHRILAELLTNAGKYASPGSTIHLQVTHRAGETVLTLCNRGVAIAPEDLPFIFDKFRRGQGITQQAIPGTGLGLALVKGLVENLHGSIAASSRPLLQGEDWESCFTLTLPQFPYSTAAVSLE